MSDYKGVGILFLRRRATEAERLDGVLRALDDADRKLFTETMAGTWVPIGFTGRAWGATATAVYPELPHDQALRTLGAELAKDNLKGVYSFFARVLSAKALLRQSAALWRVYHKRGSASVASGLSDDEDISFTVNNYEDLHPHLRTAMCGWVDGVMVLCGEEFAPFTCVSTGNGSWKFFGVRSSRNA